MACRHSIPRVAHDVHSCTDLSPRRTRRRRHTCKREIEESALPRIKVSLGGRLRVTIDVEKIELNTAEIDVEILIGCPERANTHGLTGDDSECSKCTRLPCFVHCRVLVCPSDDARCG